MNVLTWHGAVLRIDLRRARFVQDPLWLSGGDGVDFELDATSSAPVKTPLGEMVMEAAQISGTVRLRIGAGYLRASAAHRELAVEPDDTQENWDTFLLLSGNDLADLRFILDNRWRLQPGSRKLEKSDIRVTPGFRLELGPVHLDLAACLPLASYTRRNQAGGASLGYQPPPSFVIRPGDESAERLELADAPARQLTPTPHFELVARREKPPLEVETRERFMRATNCRLTLQEQEARFVSAPVVTRGIDQTLFVGFARQARVAPVGFQSACCRIRREPKRFVALARGCEGLVFDQDGSWCDLELLGKTATLPAAFTRRDGRIWVDGDALQQAPKLEGPLLVFYDGALHKYAHWLVGAMAVLDVMSRHVPRTSRLLVPGTLLDLQRRPNGFNHREIMNLLGFGRMPVLESGAEIVWADDVIFMDRPVADEIPADQLRDFRDRVLQPFGGPGERSRRLYIQRTGASGLADQTGVERFLAAQGFELVRPDYLSHEQQVKLFQEAAFVAGAHGGGLANILFSHPGVKVLELMPDDAFRPDYWRLAEKLGHVYGFLGCPRAGEAGLVPDLAALRDLCCRLDAYQA
jgi:hypothetical protein